MKINTKNELSPISPSMFRGIIIAFFIVITCGNVAFSQIELDGHYWKYNGQRVLLLGGWNHGHNPFIDHDTDNDKDNQGVSTVDQIKEAMDELTAVGGNYLRCVLNPGMAAGIQGFDYCARSNTQYDLNTMTGSFWERLEMLISEAKKREIIVQIEVWDRFDLIDGSWGSWPKSPWNPNNNVNYSSKTSGLKTSYHSFHEHPFLQGVPGHPVYDNASNERKRQYDQVREYQERFIDKLLSVTLNYNNVLYCMNNETHEHPAWGQYWMNYIQSAAHKKGKIVRTTDMFDDIYKMENSRGVKIASEYRNRYDYIDISQVNSRHRDEDHWNAVLWLSEKLKNTNPGYLLHMTKIYGNDLALNNNPWSGFKPGDSDNAIEEWWRNLLAGVAGVRFHRPTAGIGLCNQSKNCISATRKVESKVKFWDVKPMLNVLTDRESDEAYLGANPGHAYILYFTKSGQGSVGLNLEKFTNTTFVIHWVNVDTGKWGTTKPLDGGDIRTVTRPDDTAHWVAVIVKNET
jgi:hypothetical protein